MATKVTIEKQLQCTLLLKYSFFLFYCREGYVPGNPTARPKVVVHCMVNGGSDAASLLEMAVTPDGTLGDGLKVYKDSFNAY